MSEEILNATLEYLDRGFSVIPVRKDKKPYESWSQFQKRLPTENEIIGWWEKYTDANVAIITGSISNIWVIDADSDEGIIWVMNKLPRTSVYVKTSPNKLHGYYSLPHGKIVRNAVRLATDVDIRGEGGYVVAPPSIHALGHKYEWQFTLGGWEDLTEYAPKLLQQSDNLNLDLSNIKTTPINEPVTQGQRNNTLARLAGKWIRQGLEYKKIEILARDWNNKNNPPLGERELLRTIQSIRKTHERNHPIAIELKAAQIEVQKIPTAILNPSGLLQKLMDHIEENSAVSVPFFNLGAALTFLGSIMGQKFQTETGLRTNLYTIALGYSGSGKNAPFSILPQLLLETDAASTHGPTELTSSTAVLRWLSLDEHRVCLMMIDEIGHVLRGLRNPNSAAADIPRILIKLYSATDRPEIKAYADGSQIVVPWNHLSFYGASTPERFWGSLSSSDTTDGFLARILVFESKHDAPLPKKKVKRRTDKSIKDQINAIFRMTDQYDQSKGNLARVPVPKILSKTKRAQDYFDQFALKYHELKNLNKAENVASIYGRAAEHASKIALIHSVSLDYQTPKIQLESIKWACHLVEHLISQFVRQIDESIADTAEEKNQQLVLSEIKHLTPKSEYAGPTRSALLRGRCRRLGRKAMNEVLRTLIESMRIAEGSTKTSGRPATYFYIAECEDT